MNTTNTFISKLNKNTNDIIKDLNYLNTKLPYLLENDFIYPDDLLDMEISISDLNIHLQLICMKVEEIENVRLSSITINSKEENINEPTNTNESTNESTNEPTNTNESTNESTNTNEPTNEQIIESTDKLIKKTFGKFLPFMMSYMMCVDKDSILYSKTFDKINNTNNTNNTDIFKMPEIELD
jgi:hypothetical protein